jgi:hypothetical protein
MKMNFRAAKRTLGTSGGTRNVVAVNGCSYGKDNNPEKEEYLKLCGQRFWEFISNVENLYLELIKPLGQQAKEKDVKFEDEYARKVNEMTQEMLNEFCDKGLINWKRLVEFSSKK